MSDQISITSVFGLNVISVQCSKLIERGQYKSINRADEYVLFKCFVHSLKRLPLYVVCFFLFNFYPFVYPGIFE